MSDIRSQATPARDELAGEIGLEIMEVVVDLTGGYKPDGERDHNRIEKGARAILALLKPRTVNAPSEFEALPVGSVVLLTSRRAGHVAWQKQEGDRWCEASNWECSMTSLELWAVNLPATVLFTPGDAG